MSNVLPSGVSLLSAEGKKKRITELKEEERAEEGLNWN